MTYLDLQTRNFPITTHLIFSMFFYVRNSTAVEEETVKESFFWGRCIRNLINWKFQKVLSNWYIWKMQLKFASNNRFNFFALQFWRNNTFRNSYTVVWFILLIVWSFQKLLSFFVYFDLQTHTFQGKHVWFFFQFCLHRELHLSGGEIRCKSNGFYFFWQFCESPNFRKKMLTELNCFETVTQFLSKYRLGIHHQYLLRDNYTWERRSFWKKFSSEHSLTLLIGWKMQKVLVIMFRFEMKTFFQGFFKFDFNNQSF